MNSSFYDRLKRRNHPSNQEEMTNPRSSQRSRLARAVAKKTKSGGQSSQPSPRNQTPADHNSPGSLTKTNDRVQTGELSPVPDVEDEIAPVQGSVQVPSGRDADESSSLRNKVATKNSSSITRRHAPVATSSERNDAPLLDRSDRERALEEQLARQKQMMDEMKSFMSEMMGKRPSPAGPPHDSTEMPISKKPRASEIRTLKREWEILMEDHLPHFDIAFARPLIARCLFNTSCSLLLSAWSDRAPTAHGILEALDAMYFSIMPNEKKDEWATSFGRRASTFRTRVMICMLMNLRMDTFRIFRHKSDTKDQRPQKPFWLEAPKDDKPGYIGRRDIISAVQSWEKRGGGFGNYGARLKQIRKGKFDRADDALFAMRTLYSTITKHLNESRKAGSAEFYDVVGYLFADWSTFRNCPVKDCDLSLTWAADAADSVVVNINDIPDCHMHTAGMDDRTEKNEILYNTFLDSHPELILIVEHDVMVRVGARSSCSRRHPGEEKKRWKRGIHLMDAAAYFMKSFCLYDKSEAIAELLSYHRRSIAVLYVFATVLREVLDTRVGRTINRKGNLAAVTQSDDIRSSQEPAAVKKEMSDDLRKRLDEIFDFLMPCEGTVIRNANHILCSFPEETFNEEHLGEESKPLRPNEDNEEMADDLERSLDMYQFDM